MAKSSKDNEEEYFNSSTQHVLLLSTKFVYDVEIYKFGIRSYNLEDSKYVNSPTHLANNEEYFTKDNVRFRKVATLVAAPSKWLKENNYVKR